MGHNSSRKTATSKRIFLPHLTSAEKSEKIPKIFEMKLNFGVGKFLYSSLIYHKKGLINSELKIRLNIQNVVYFLGW